MDLETPPNHLTSYDENLLSRLRVTEAQRAYLRHFWSGRADDFSGFSPIYLVPLGIVAALTVRWLEFPDRAILGGVAAAAATLWALIELFIAVGPATCVKKILYSTEDSDLREGFLDREYVSRALPAKPNLMSVYVAVAPFAIATAAYLAGYQWLVLLYIVLYGTAWFCWRYCRQGILRIIEQEIERGGGGPDA